MRATTSGRLNSRRGKTLLPSPLEIAQGTPPGGVDSLGQRGQHPLPRGEQAPYQGETDLSPVGVAGKHQIDPGGGVPVPVLGLMGQQNGQLPPPGRPPISSPRVPLGEIFVGQAEEGKAALPRPDGGGLVFQHHRPRLLQAGQQLAPDLGRQHPLVVAGDIVHWGQGGQPPDQLQGGGQVGAVAVHNVPGDHHQVGSQPGRRL